MSDFQDRVASDVENVFLGREEFDVEVTYYLGLIGLPNTFRAQVLEDVEQDPEADSDLDADFKQLLVSAADVPAPSVAGRAPPDRIELPGDARTWYLIEVLENGVSSGSGMHRLRICDKARAYGD